MWNYFTLCKNLIKTLPERQREIICRRFGLYFEKEKERKKETLQAIGEDFGITRERVRQIENDGLRKIKKKISSLEKVFEFFKDYLKSHKGIKKEEILSEELGGEKFKNHVLFLLSLSDSFHRHKETEEFFSFWFLEDKFIKKAKKIISQFIKKLKKAKTPLKLPSTYPLSYIEISKKIGKSIDGLYGLVEWPEITPKGIRDKAYLILQQQKKPLHFTEVATLINSSSFFSPYKKVTVQAVHNELIKDPRFVLVGRGIYALKDWGYEEGTVKDIILSILKKAQRPLTKEEILEEVLKQREVKKSTILLNLNNKTYILKTEEGKYTIRKA